MSRDIDSPRPRVKPSTLTRACAEVEHQLRSRPEYAHTSHLRVEIDGTVLHDLHLRGPLVADTFSVTKSVLATLVGVAVGDGLVRDLDLTLEAVLDVGDTPSAGQTLRQLLTMTRGSQPDGPYELDAVAALGSGWVRRFAEAPRIVPAGERFAYEGGGAHLLAAALTRLVGRSLSDYAADRLFGPLGIGEWEWRRDPDGIEIGAAHLRLSAGSLARLGKLWMDGGRWRGQQLVDPEFAQAMTTPQNPGGPPERRPYGYLLWIDEHGPFAGGWAGQHVTVVPAARAVIVTTGDPRFDPGPPPTDELSPDWRPARELVVEHLLPVLLH